MKKFRLMEGRTEKLDPETYLIFLSKSNDAMFKQKKKKSNDAMDLGEWKIGVVTSGNYLRTIIQPLVRFSIDSS